MDRHPLIFLGVVILIGALNFMTLMYLALLHARVQPVAKLLHELRNDVHTRIDLEEERLRRLAGRESTDGR